MVAGAEAHVSFRYDPLLVEVVKSLPRGTRLWDAGRRIWVVDADYVDMLVDAFTDEGCQVRVSRYGSASADGAGGWGQTTEERAHPAEPFEALFASLPPDLARRAYRALVKVCHPDTGGDTAVCQRLTQAAARRGLDRP